MISEKSLKLSKTLLSLEGKSSIAAFYARLAKRSEEFEIFLDSGFRLDDNEVEIYKEFSFLKTIVGGFNGKSAFKVSTETFSKLRSVVLRRFSGVESLLRKVQNLDIKLLKATYGGEDFVMIPISSINQIVSILADMYCGEAVIARLVFRADEIAPEISNIRDNIEQPSIVQIQEVSQVIVKKLDTIERNDVLEIVKTVGYRLPPMADEIVSELTQKEYIDAFPFGLSAIFVSDTKVEAIDKFSDDVTSCISPNIYGKWSMARIRQAIDAIVIKKGITFKPVKPLVVAFDIETFWYNTPDTDSNIVPVPENTADCGISIIGSYYIDPESGIRKSKAYCLRPYSYNGDISVINTQILQMGIECTWAEDQSALCLAFRNDIVDLSKKFHELVLLSFNGSSEMRTGDWKEGKNGYDLKFILYRCGLSGALVSYSASAFKGISTSNKSEHTGLSNLASQTAVSNYFGPRVHFADLRSFLFGSFHDLEMEGYVSGKRLKGMRLADYLEALGLQSKDNIDSSRIGDCLRTLMPSKSCPYTYPEVVKYCIRDCSALIDIDIKIDFSMRHNILAETTKCPISTAYHRTLAQCGTFYLLKNIYQDAEKVTFWCFSDLTRFVDAAQKNIDKFTELDINNILSSVGYLGNSTSLKKHGRFLGALNLDRTELIRHDGITVQRDFKSLYPSVMNTFCICQWNFIGIIKAEYGQVVPNDEIWIPNDPTLLELPVVDDREKINRIFQIGDSSISSEIGDKTSKCYVRFRNNYNHPFLSTIRNVLAIRNQWKGEMKKYKYGSAEYVRCNNLQLCYKRIANSLYGLTGSEVSPIYNYFCGASVTLGARIATSSAIKVIRENVGLISYADTDSVANASNYTGELVSQDESQRREYWLSFCDHENEVTKQVNNSLRVIIQEMCPSAHVNHLEMAFEADKVMIKSIHPKKKKMYIYLNYCPCGDSFTTKLKSSGFQFSQTSEYVEQTTKNICSEILSAKSDETDTILRNFILREYERINTDTIDDYSFGYKPTHNITKFICDRWPEYLDSDKKLRAFPVSDKTIKESARRWAPIDKSNEFADKIDKSKILQLCFSKNLSKVWPQFAQMIKPDVETDRIQLFKGDVIVRTGNLMVRKESVKGARKYYSAPEEFDLDGIREMLDNAPDNTSFHEIPDHSCNGRFYLDIDLKFSDEPNCRETPRSLMDYINSRVWELLGFHAEVEELSASDNTKISLHPVYHVSMPFELMLLKATELKKLVSQVDLQVYTDNHSLRIPCCNKLGDDGSVVKRQFILLGKTREETISRIDQCMVGNLFAKNGKLIRSEDSMYGLPPQICIRGPFSSAFLSGSGFVTDDPSNELIAAIAKLLGVCEKSIEHNVGFEDGEPKYYRMKTSEKNVKCPICSSPNEPWFHKNEHLRIYKNSTGWWVNCFAAIGAAARCKNPGSGPINIIPIKAGKIVGGKTKAYIKKAISTLPEWEQKRPVKSAERYVKYDDSADVTFVRASCGSGKTYCYEHDLAEKYASTIAITARRTYAVNMHRRFADLHFTNYLDMKGKIRFGSNTRLLLQVDSLSKLDMSSGHPADLLLIDETEAVSEQILSCAGSNGKDIAALYERLIRTSRKIICLDALLSDRTIEMFKRIRGSTAKYSIVNHTTQPFDGFNVKCRVCSVFDDRMGHLPDCIVEEMISLRRDKGPIVSFCASQTFASHIAKEFRSNGLKVFVYDGADLNLLLDKRTMYESKREDLPKINEVIRDNAIDLLIYTSSISVGVSIELENYFALSYNIFSGNISSHVMYQAMQRVRQFTTNLAYLIIVPLASASSEGLTMAKAIAKFSIQPAIAKISEQMLAAISCGYDTMAKVWIPYILDLIWRDGASVSELNQFITPPERVSNPLRVDKAAVLQSVILSKEQVERAILIDKNEHIGKSGKNMPEGMEDAMKKYKLMCKLGMSVDEVNSLNIYHIRAALEYCEKKMMLFGRSISEESSFDLKIQRLSAICDAKKAKHSTEKIDAQPGIIESTASEIDCKVDKKHRIVCAEEQAIKQAEESGLIISKHNKIQSLARSEVQREIYNAIMDKLRQIAVTICGKNGLVPVDAFDKICCAIVKETKAEEIKTNFGSSCLSDPTGFVIEILNAVPVKIAYNIAIKGSLYYQFEQIDSGADQPEETIRNERREIILSEVTTTGESVEEMKSKLNGIDVDSADFPNNIESLKNVKITLVAAGDICVKLLFAIYLKFDIEKADVLASKVRSYIDSKIRTNGSFSSGIYKTLGKYIKCEKQRKLFYCMSKELSAEVRKKSATSAKTKPPVDGSLVPCSSIMEAMAADYASGKKQMDENGIIVTMYVTGARLKEVHRGSVIVEEGGKWFYLGVIKGRNISTDKFPLISLVDPQVAKKCLELAYQYCSTDKYDSLRKRMDRYVKNKYFDKKNAKKHLTPKDFRKVASNVIPQVLVERRLYENTPANIARLSGEYLHHKQNDGAEANVLCYMNVKLN
jgi:hypothetical protein